MFGVQILISIIEHMSCVTSYTDNMYARHCVHAYLSCILYVLRDNNIYMQDNAVFIVFLMNFMIFHLSSEYIKTEARRCLLFHSVAVNAKVKHYSGYKKKMKNRRAMRC